uniref:Uncharacterized protein n=1 Tax=Sulfolobus islandicus rod-shaped virus 1 TaxID=157898 RepID=Q5W373_SIRV1|nr:hypothetical protein [Sulfolobus islandicus rod-shaped virus 1]
MSTKIIYKCPIDNKDILILDTDTLDAIIGKCDHVFGYAVSPFYLVKFDYLTSYFHFIKEDDVCPKQFRVKSWSIKGLTYGICVLFKYVTRDKKELKKILEKLLYYSEDQAIYFILGDSTRREIIDKIKDMIKDMFVGYKADSEFCTPKIITIVGVLNKVTIYFL